VDPRGVTLLRRLAPPRGTHQFPPGSVNFPV
jgi:hypothetical protein